MGDRARQAAGTLLSGSNAAFVEMLYDRYLESPQSVGEEWRAYFASLPGNGADVAHGPIVGEIAHRAKHARFPARPPLGGEAPAPAAGADTADAERQMKVSHLITRYRFLGSRCARLNPLGQDSRDDPYRARLGLEGSGLGKADLGRTFRTDIVGLERATLAEIIDAMERAYCGTFSVEHRHIIDDAQRNWLQERVESAGQSPGLDPALRVRALDRLTAGEQLEQYLHTKYVGQKRFSLEGGESLIPLLDDLVGYASDRDVVEVVIGMAHRGRLNVLVNILGKLPSDLFSEFEGRHEIAGSSSGDVKYHMGFSSTLQAGERRVHLALAFNPSHLEIVNPVVQGSVRARQDRRKDPARRTVMPILVHGDASFAGQGVVMETLNLSQARGFKTGGTIHVIVNNQIGFTTSTPDDARSTFFCSDVAKMVEVPIIHVNGDDPDACVRAARLAFDFRREFGRDVVIDVVCYRRHGHNEQDEPMVTQPLMYKRIKALRTTREIYAERLVAEGVVGKDEPRAMIDRVRRLLDAQESTNPSVLPTDRSAFVDWGAFSDGEGEVDTHFDPGRLAELGRKVSEIPGSFVPHPRLKRVIEARRGMADGKLPVDWGMAENLAYATLLDEGYNVRLSGQDCGRGTFFHRHAVWHDQSRDRRDGGSHVPLRNLSEGQGDFLVIDSLLSEEAVLGFEYGYATTQPNALVVWEAQFGDFANGAQVVIDQFIAAGRVKWGRMCNLVMLLPHGYEGQGPEHSSARLERYLQLCAEANMDVCVPSTPGQVFHMLRRQMRRKLRRPLVVISPKSLLRHKNAVSPLSELADGGFRAVLPDTRDIDPARVRRVVLCSGKIHYELDEAREREGIDDVALLRLEQLYPYPEGELKERLAPYAKSTELLWCQEEPRNQGAWLRLRGLFTRVAGDQTLLVSMRPSSASPATGHASSHKREQTAVINGALGIGGAKPQRTAAVVVARKRPGRPRKKAE